MFSWFSYFWFLIFTSPSGCRGARGPPTLTLHLPPPGQAPISSCKCIPQPPAAWCGGHWPHLATRAHLKCCWSKWRCGRECTPGFKDLISTKDVNYLVNDFCIDYIGNDTILDILGEVKPKLISSVSFCVLNVAVECLKSHRWLALCWQHWPGRRSPASEAHVCLPWIVLGNSSWNAGWWPRSISDTNKSKLHYNILFCSKQIILGWH